MTQETPTQEVLIKLVCSVTGQPIRDALAIVRLWDGQSLKTVAEGRTNEQGEVRFNLPHGYYYVNFDIGSPLYDNFATWTHFAVPVPESNMPIVVRAARVAEEVKVRVIESEINPRPVVGGHVSAFRLMFWQGQPYFFYEDTKQTNEQGEAVLILRRNYQYFIDSSVGADVRIIRVPDQTSVTLTALETVYVRVIDAETSLPIPGAEAVIVRGVISTDHPARGETDENGIVVFYLSRVHEYRIRVSAPGYRTSEISVMTYTTLDDLIHGQRRNLFVVRLERELPAPRPPSPIQPPPEQPPTQPPQPPPEQQPLAPPSQPPTHPPISPNLPGPPQSPTEQPLINNKLLLLGIGTLAAVALILIARKGED